MTDPDLFPEAQGLSPRLSWLKKHSLMTYKKKRADEKPWVCASKITAIIHDGVDENEAIMNYCEDQKIKHWTIEP